MHGRSVERFISKAVNAEKQADSNKKSSVDTVEIYLPKFYFWAGMGCAAVNLTVAVLGLFLDESEIRFIAVGYFTLFALGCGFLMWVQKIWGIIVCCDEGCFYYTTIFARVYKYSFSDCTVSSVTRNRVVLKAKDKTFHIDPHAINIDTLLVHLKKNS